MLFRSRRVVACAVLTGLPLAYLAGLVTVLNPCVLPVLPVVLGAALGQSAYGPLALGAGLVAAFSTFGLIVTAFGFALGLSEVLLRTIAASVLLGAGVVLLVPVLQQALVAAASPLTAGANRMLGHVGGQGLAGQFALGLLLGVVWSPCVGPTLGVAIASASQGRNLGEAFATFLVFGCGVVSVLLLIAYGSRSALGRRGQRARAAARFAKPLLGGVLVMVGALVLSGADRVIEGWILEHMPATLVTFTTRY